HWQPRRLEAEVIRDALLAVSGELDRGVGGASVPDDGKSLRRTLYLLQKRENPPAVSALFDGPNAAAESCPKRTTTTVPLQALYLLNNDFCVRRAQTLAERVTKEAGDDRAKQIDAAFRSVLGRVPDKVEREA